MAAGLSPREVQRTSIWHFRAAIQGWAKANGGDGPLRAPTPEQHDENVRRLALQAGDVKPAPS